MDIGDWSVCDHVCGGGTMFKFSCVKPVGGYKCERHLKLKKSCNTKPCAAGENPAKIDNGEDWLSKQPTLTLPMKLDSR